MTPCAQYLSAIWGTVKRDALIFNSYRLRIITQLVGVLFTLTIFNYVAKLVRPGAVGRHSHYYAFVVVGIICVTLLRSAVTLSTLVRIELMQGNFERVTVSPLGPVGGAIALAIFPIAYAIVFAALTLALAIGVFGISVHILGIPEALGLGVLGAAAFTGIGLIFVAGLFAIKSGLGALSVFALLSVLGGAYFPVTLFPGWIRWASDVQPFTPAVDLFRHVLLGTPAAAPAWLELVKLAGFTVVLLPMSVALVWAAVNLSRRRGTLMEY